MAKTIQRTVGYSTSPEGLFATLIDPAAITHRHRAQGAIEATVHEVERTERRLVQRVDVREYAHKKTGGRDHSKIESTETTYEWDLPARKGSWTYRGAQGDRVRIGGSFAVHARGQGAELETKVDIRVDVPLLGRVIEGLIATDIEEFLVSYRPPDAPK